MGHSQVPISLLKLSICEDIQVFAIYFFLLVYDLPIVPESAGCAPELPEMIKNTDSWALPLEIESVDLG